MNVRNTDGGKIARGMVENEMSSGYRMDPRLEPRDERATSDDVGLEKVAPILPSAVEESEKAKATGTMT